MVSSVFIYNNTMPFPEFHDTLKARIQNTKKRIFITETTAHMATE